MRIVVVEDEAGIADFLERGLRREGHQVRVALDGIEGARLALGQEIDLVLLDLLLPGLDGLELLNRLRSTRPALPVLILTAGSHPPAPDEHFDRSTRWIQKPFPFTDLIVLIDEMAEEGKGESGPKSSATI